MAGKSTFLSFATEDESRVPALLAALDAWEVSFRLLAPTKQPEGTLAAETRQAIHDCEVYLRLCTGGTRASAPMTLADDAFHQLIASDRRKGNLAKRKLVNLILDPAYQPDDQDKATLYIDTLDKTRALWLEQLAVPLGVATLKQRISRRALVGMGIGAALTVITGGSLAAVLIQQQRQRILTDTVLPNTKNVSGQVNWTIPLGDFVDESSNVSTLLTYERGVLYATTNDILRIGAFVLSPAQHTAQQISLHLTSVPDKASFDSARILGGVVFATYANPVSGQIHNVVFDPRTGSLAYQLDTANIGIPAVVGESFYCVNVSPSGDPFVSAFRLRDGARIWQQPVAPDPNQYNSLDGVDLLSVEQGSVYVSTFDHTLLCFDAATGGRKWQSGLTSQATSPVIVGNTVFVGTWDGSVFALDTATGHQRWHTSVRESIVTAPTISNDTIYIGTTDGSLFALDARSGAQYWRSVLGDVHTNESPFAIDYPPVIYRNVVAMVSGDYLFAHDLRDGSFRWRFTLIQSLTRLSKPILYNGLMLVGGGDGKVYALNP